MAKQLQLRRGTTAQHSTFTGALAEITVDTDKKVAVIHDGTTVGGFPLARADGIVATATTANALNTSNAYTGTSFNSITGLSSTTPIVAGTAAVGTATTAARADHVHGSDTTKVDKVTSTDNAIARYDGTGGAIQNSSAYIDDSGNVGIGTSGPNVGGSGANGKVLTIKGNTTGYGGTIELQMPSYASTSGDMGFIKFFNGTTENARIYANPDGNNTDSGKMLFYTRQNGGTLTERMRIDSAGNVGIGVTPSAWSAGKALEIGGFGNGLFYSGSNNFRLTSNAYYNSGYKYGQDGTATMYEFDVGSHKWHTAPSGTAGNPITWTQAMTLDASGNLFVGRTSQLNGARLSIDVGSGASSYSSFGNDHIFYNCNSGGANTSSTGYFVQKISATGRSINAAGTINASGADYAEYEYNNNLVIAKGQIVGFKADGTLTDKYSESIRFAIKSTNPSYVGGDTWGSEDVVGKRPEQPTRKQDITEQKLVSEAVAEVIEDKIIDAVLDDDGNEIEPSKIEKVIITPAQEAIYETVIVEAGDTDAEWEAKETQYKTDLADFEARLEAERIKVDRIAYSGKVPVNVTGAVAGQYVCVIAGENDSIGYELVNKADMTFVQYQDAVGRVNRILDDGRAEVAVVIH